MAIEVGGAAFNAARWHGDEPHEGIAHHRFARPRFAYDAQGFARGYLEGHAVHRPHDAVAGVEVGAQIVYREKGHRRSHTILGGTGMDRQIFLGITGHINGEALAYANRRIVEAGPAQDVIRRDAEALGQRT